MHIDHWLVTVSYIIIFIEMLIALAINIDELSSYSSLSPSLSSITEESQGDNTQAKKTDFGNR